MTKFYSTALFKNIYKKPSTKSEITSQILFGEKFKIILKKKNWIKIKSISDNYKGFIKNNKLLEKLNLTHKCFSLKTRIYKYKKTKRFVGTKLFLPFNSRISLNNTKNNFVEFQKNKWVKKKI